MAEIKMEIKEELGVINEKKNVRVRLVAWNDRDAKYDIRPWWTDDDGNERASKGLTFTKEEMMKLKEIINSIV